MEDENKIEESTEDLDSQNQTITITGLSLEDAAEIILQEQETPGHYQILTHELPDMPVSEGQACVTVVQEVAGNSMGVYEGSLSGQTPETMYITPEMINNGTIQISDGSMFLAQDIGQQGDGRNDYNTVYITPGELEHSVQKEASQSGEGEESIAIETAGAVVPESLNDEGTTDENTKPEMGNFRTVHVNVIQLEENKTQDVTSEGNIDNKAGKEQCHDESTNDVNIESNDQADISNELKNEEALKTYTAVPEEVLPKDEVKTIDLSKPIEVTDSTEIIIKGKKCVLMPHPDTGQLCAYPVVPNQAKRKRGRPKKAERREDQDYIPPSQTEEGGKEKPTAKPGVNKMDQANAVEGLLELSNTGPDGIRRSSRAKKKKTLEDYEMIEESDEENHEQNPPPVGDDNYIPPSYAIAAMNPGFKRGRGRPRRYPPPGQTSTTSIPAVIIPGANGQTLMMAPIQGIQNFQAFQEQVKSLPSLLTKPSDDGNTINAQIISTSDGQIISSSAGQIITTSEGQILSTANGQIISTDPNSIITSNSEQSVISSDSFLVETSASINSMTSTSALDTVSADSTDTTIISTEGTEAVDHDDGLENETSDINDGDADLEEVAAASAQAMATIINTDDCSEGLKGDITTTSEGQTVLQIPEDLLPMFIPKKDPVKLGLKASEKELEKLKCPKCDFQAFYLQQYQSHIAIHSDDVQKCKCCNYISFDRDSLLQHVKETHPRCICTICDFMAEHAYVIKRHMMRHSGDGCTCEICGKTYKDQYILKMHVKMVHMPADVLFECTVCFKKFTRKAHLKRHLRIHEAEKPYKCPHCEYRGCERSDISKHLLIHEEPKHVCKVCGKAFRHIKNKELHMKRHNGQKDYKCGVCDFYGYTFTDIRKHIERRHADIKTLVCDKCGSAFKSEALLREHQKQQCEVFMIEQGFSIATSTGGTSQATIQIPTSLSVEGQHITIDGQQITVEQVIPEEDISLTEDELRESLQNGSISEAQVIEACQVDMDEVEEHSAMHIVDGIDTDDGLSMSLG